MSDVELVYYSRERPINKLELDMILFNLPDDFIIESKVMNHRSENKVYLVKINYPKKKVVLGYKEGA